MKTTRTDPAEIPCFECENGHLLPIIKDYTSSLGGQQAVTIEKVPMLRCNQCGDVVLGEAGNRKIETRLREATNTL